MNPELQVFNIVNQAFLSSEYGDRIPSQELADFIGHGFDPRKVAAWVEPFGIHSKDIRFDTQVLKGYMRDQFDDVFAQYGVKSTELPTPREADFDEQWAAKPVETI